MKISKNIDEAVNLLLHNELVVIPTETVYGLAANMYSESAVEAIYHYKKRPKSNPLIVHVSSVSKLEEIGKNISRTAYQLAEKYWPGPLTLLVEKSDKIPYYVTSGSNKVAVRIPNHSLTIDLLNEIQIPIVAPSANPYQRVSPTKVSHVVNYFKNELPLVLDGGDCMQGIESTIIDTTLGEGRIQILRAGTITKEVLMNDFPDLCFEESDSSEIVPGAAKKHYSPLKKLYFNCNESELISLSNKRVGLITLTKLNDSVLKPFKSVHFDGDIELSSRDLYAVLIAFENDPEIDVIVCFSFPNEGIGLALNDKLRRAVN